MFSNNYYHMYYIHTKYKLYNYYYTYNIRNFALRNILKNTDGTSGINACGDGSSGKSSAKMTCETTVKEARKSKHCTRCKEEA